MERTRTRKPCDDVRRLPRCASPGVPFWPARGMRQTDSATASPPSGRCVVPGDVAVEVGCSLDHVAHHRLRAPAKSLAHGTSCRYWSNAACSRSSNGFGIRDLVRDGPDVPRTRRRRPSSPPSPCREPAAPARAAPASGLSNVASAMEITSRANDRDPGSSKFQRRQQERAERLVEREILRQVDGACSSRRAPLRRSISMTSVSISVRKISSAHERSARFCSSVCAESSMSALDAVRRRLPARLRSAPWNG